MTHDEELEYLRKQNSILSGQLDTMKINLDYYKKKSTEYEDKVVSFDRIKAYSDKTINGEIHHPIVLAEGVIDVVEQYYINRMSESGDSDGS